MILAETREILNLQDLLTFRRNDVIPNVILNLYNISNIDAEIEQISARLEFRMTIRSAIQESAFKNDKIL